MSFHTTRGMSACRQPVCRTIRLTLNVSRHLQTSLIVGAVSLVCLLGIFAASLVNWRAADVMCGSLFALDERFADSHEVSMENRLFPLPVDCRFDNGVTLSYRWWPTASP
jgi:hypothetical protein